jgi:putative ABC transport system permease protein
MRALDRKLLRDLWNMRGQALAICLVMACGVAMFVMSMSTLESLENTQQSFYDRYRFAHAFTRVKRAPKSLAASVAEIPGIAEVQTRIVIDVILDLPDFIEPASGRLISVPDRTAPNLNQLYLRRGRWLEPGRTGEVLVSEGFTDAHKFQPGDQVTAVINGQFQKLRIVGVVLSPEYVYQIRPGDLFPDPKRFGIFWMSETDLAAAYDMTGAFNDITVRLEPGAVEKEVLLQLDRLTEDYGGLGAYSRDDQVSNKFVTNEIRELRGMTMVAPSIFLGVAAFLLHLVMGRLISTQREQIAALKAFGYSRIEIGWHYLKMVLVLVVVGVALGTFFGAWMGSGLTAMYTRFFRFPELMYFLRPGIAVLAMGITGGAAIGGTLGAVWRAMRLPPAEAMRPEPPATFRPTVVERLGLQRLFSPAARMVLRQLERYPVKAGMSVFGIATAVAVLVVGRFMLDSINYVIEAQFFYAQRQDITVTFIEPASGRILHDLTHLPGVQYAEPFRLVAARMRHEHRHRLVGIQGIEAHGRLNLLIDIYQNQIDLPAEGLVLSKKLAEVLEVNVGETVTVEVLEGKRPTREIVVAGVLADFVGLGAYMNRPALNRVMQEGPVASGAYLAVDRLALASLYRELKETPRIAGVGVKEAGLQSFTDTIAENMLRMQFFQVLFACVIAFGVVYNSARIALAERSRELATLRVMGFTRAEVARILLGELAVLTVLAIPLGLVLGYFLAWSMSHAFDTELFRIPLVVSRYTYGFATLVVLIATVLSGLVVLRRIRRLDLVAVLKTRE